jgi:hypothetical protein
MLFPMMTAEWQYFVLYFSTEYQKFRQNIIIMFWKYVVDIRSKAWPNLFLGIHKWKNVDSVPPVQNRDILSFSVAVAFQLVLYG